MASLLTFVPAHALPANQAGVPPKTFRRKRLYRAPPKLRSRHPQCAVAERPQRKLPLPDSSTDLTSFISWCEEKGIRLNSIEILSNGRGRRGLFATRPIQPGTPVLTIPRRVALIADTSTSEPPQFEHLPLKATFWQSCSWASRLALHLLNELLKPSSPVSPYLAVLPANPATALWAYDTLGRSSLSLQLTPYHLTGVLDKHRAHIKSEFNALRATLPAEVRERVSLHDFSWAVSVAQSRAFGIPPKRPAPSLDELTRRKVVAEPTQYALFPALDMANHSVHYPTSFTYDDAQDAYIVSTAAVFRPGEEVFLSYGPKPNDDLLFFYGCVEGNNPENAVTIADLREWILQLAHDEGRAADWDCKLAILAKHGLTDPHRLFQFRMDAAPDDLMLVVRLAVASHSELTSFLQELVRDDRRMFKPLCLENELNAWAAIDTKCQKLLDEQGDFTPEEQDKLTNMFKAHPCSAVWSWGETGSPGELLYRYERQSVLAATSERVRHFAHISSSVGRICTVLVPPTQSLLKTNLFSGMSDEETAGIHRFNISPEDLQLS